MFWDDLNSNNIQGPRSIRVKISSFLEGFPYNLNNFMNFRKISIFFFQLKLMPFVRHAIKTIAPLRVNIWLTLGGRGPGSRNDWLTFTK